MKLDETNYLIWQKKIKHVITVYNLQDLINEFVLPLVKIIKKVIQTTASSGQIQDCEVLEEHPSYRLWTKQDSDIKNLIYSYVSFSHLKYLIRKGTVSQYWKALHKVFNDDSQSRLIELH